MIRLIELFCQKWKWTTVKQIKPNFLLHERLKPVHKNSVGM